MELEHYRKDAKQLLRAFRIGKPEALHRAQEVVGERAHERFQLGDAQHVVAIEHGYRSWPELKHALEHADQLAQSRGSAWRLCRSMRSGRAS